MNRPNHKAQAFEGVSRVVGLRSRTTTLALILAGLASTGADAALGVLAGSGTDASPYQVSDYADLCAVGTGTYSSMATYRLTADIDASPSDTSNSDSGFAPISFKGTFHGGGHTISRLSVNRPGHDAALFSLVDLDAELDSIWLVGAKINGSHHVGVLAATNRGSIVSCSSTGIVVGDTALSHVGGLVGTNSGTIRASRSSSLDSGDQGISSGGLVGVNTGTIESSGASGTVTAGRFAGGLVGRSDSANIAICYATGAVTTTGTDALAGGLVAVAGVGDKIRQCYASGPVTATGSNVFAGGLVGLNRGVVEGCYAISKVVNSESSFLPGGLVGNDSGSILTSYWGLESASSTVGVGYGLSTASATGLIAVAMAIPASFAGWDFSTTWMLGGADTVPLLRALASSYGVASVHPQASRSRLSYAWNTNGKRLTISVPGKRFDVVMVDPSGRILARASASGTTTLELANSGAIVVQILSGDLHESFAVAASR